MSAQPDARQSEGTIPLNLQGVSFPFGIQLGAGQLQVVLAEVRQCTAQESSACSGSPGQTTTVAPDSASGIQASQRAAPRIESGYPEQGFLRFGGDFRTQLLHTDPRGDFHPQLFLFALLELVHVFW